MTSKVWRMAVRIGFLAGLAMMSYGCDLGGKKTSYNLKYVACRPDKTVEVEIKSAAVVPVDQYVFVCVGDKVRWFTEDDLTFTAKFDDTATAKTTTLFESGEGSFTSKPDTGPSVSDKKHHKQVTDTQIVGPNATQYQDYSYQVLARDKSGKTVSTNDPHVIPMGNGGS
jgi:plastocyanin